MKELTNYLLEEIKNLKSERDYWMEQSAETQLKGQAKIEELECELGNLKLGLNREAVVDNSYHCSDIHNRIHDQALKMSEALRSKPQNPSGGCGEAAFANSKAFFGESKSTEIPWTPRLKKCLALARKEALRRGHSYVGQEHLLAGIVLENEGDGARLLNERGITVEDIAEFSKWTSVTPPISPPSGGCGEAVVEPQYRMLKLGDVFEEGDEMFAFNTGPWEPVLADNIGRAFTNGYVKHRRPLK